MPAKASAGLAVTLGIAAVIMTGWTSGVAWADESGATKGSTSSSTASATQQAATQPDDTSAEADSPNTTGSATKHDAVRPMPQVDTGERTEDASTATTAQPSETPQRPEPAVDERPSSKPRSPKRSHQTAPKPTSPKTPGTVVDAEQDTTSPTNNTHKETADVVSRLTAATEPDVATRAIASTPSSSVVTMSTESTTKPVRPNVVRAVIGLVSGVVNAILSPFAASGTPGAPKGVPGAWALLAFVRREFERAFTTPSVSPTPAGPQTTSVEPGERTLILSAFPAEADAILARTTLDPNPSVVVDGRHFYLGTLGGKKVIVAMTGIGMVNATQTAETALNYFTRESGTSIGAVVFSGVAGGSGRTEIGDVAVPARWTSDDGATWHAVDSGMLAVANTLTVDLLNTDSIGDPACACGLFAGPRIDLKREPELHVGGDGSSDDNNNGTAFPAIPLGGDIFGPQPCAAPDFSPLFFGNFFQAVGPFLASGLLTNLTGLLNPVVPAVDAVDMETAAAQQVAEAHGIPFLGIRGMSDGPGDPLNLPGYPFTFFVYKQIAADNAAIVTEAFLQNWAGD
jgi:nucleoside phosphorylase